MEDTMTYQEAIRILMLSPFYYKLTPDERNRLIKDYCRSFVTAVEPKTCSKLKSED